MIGHLSEQLSDKEERILSELLKSNPEFKLKYEEMAKHHAISFTSTIEACKRSNYFNNIKLVFNTKNHYIRYYLRIAAIIFFIITTSISSYFIFRENIFSSDRMMSYKTIVPQGSQSKIILPDGTLVWLNSGSTLEYKNTYGKKNRDVILTGEGYFEVKKNPSKPFLVHTGNIQVKVLGTIFNVRSYIDEPSEEVDLLEGKINIYFENKKSSDRLIMKPNEKMIYNKKSNSIHTCKVIASRSALWTTGKLSFVDASLEEIAKNLERRYDVKIIIRSSTVKDELFSGSLDLNQPIDKVLEYIDVDKKYIRIYNGKTIMIKNR